VVLRVEAAGRPVWRRIEPIARRMLPIESTAKALGAGLAWGWVPCGLVYSMLVLAAASGSAAEGALVMAAFGLGTLPNLLAAGLAAQRLLAIRRVPWIRRAAGAAIVALGVFGIARLPGLPEALAAGWRCIA
jgi:sulfite exporter TauE/SafE